VSRSLEGRWSGAGIFPVAVIVALGSWAVSVLVEKDGQSGATGQSLPALSGSGSSLWDQKSEIAPLLADRSFIAGYPRQDPSTLLGTQFVSPSLTRLPEASHLPVAEPLTSANSLPEKAVRSAVPLRSQIGFAEPSLAVSQRAHAAVLTLVRQRGSSGRVRVFWKTIDGSAKSGVDYEGISAGTAEFAEHEMRRLIYIGLKPNDRTGNRSFTVLLSGAGGNAQLHGVTRVPVTLIDY